MKLEQALLHLGSLLIWAGVPLACSTALADAVEVPKSAAFTAGALLVTFAWLLGAARKTWPWLRVGRLTLVWVLFYAWWACSAFWGVGGLNGQIPALEHALCLMLLLAWTASGSRQSWRAWFWMIFLAGLLVTGYAWLQRFGRDVTSWSHPEYSVIRTISTMGNPNYLALYLVAWLPLSLPVVAPRRWLWLPWLLGFAALVQTGTRGAWLACLVCLVVACALRPGKRVLLVGLILLLTAGLVIWKGAEVLGQRAQASSVGNVDVAARVYLWRAAWATLLSQPMGVGPGGFTGEALKYREWEPMETRSWQRLAENPHNQLLSVGVDAGWMGVLLLLAGLVGFLWGRARRARRSLTELSLLLTGVGLSVHLLTLNLALPAEVLWLAALSWPGQHDPPAGRQPPVVMVALAGLLWLAGTLLAAGWVVGERTFWLADEDRYNGFAMLKENKNPGAVLDRAVSSYLEAERLVQPQRRADVASALGSLYSQLALQLQNNPKLCQAAETAFLQASELDPRNPYHLMGLADLASRQRGSGEAYLRMALKIDPRNPAFWALLGEDYFKQGKFAQAEECLRQSLRIYPDHPGTIYRLGETLVRLGREEEGKSLMEQARKLDSRLPPG